MFKYLLHNPILVAVLVLALLLTKRCLGAEPVQCQDRWVALIATTVASEELRTIPAAVVPVEEAEAEVSPVVLIERPPKKTIKRLKGPHHTWPDYPCQMYLGEHLLGMHKQPRKYIDGLTYKQWTVLHDNIHNTAPVAKKQARSSPCGPRGCRLPRGRLFRWGRRR